MLKIFISYSWKNMAQRDALISKLERAGHEPIWDQRFVPPADDLNRGIVNMLDRADAAVACLTADSVRSYAVREELTRAHHQSLRVYPIVHRSVVPDLPWFLHSPVRLQYDTEQEMLNSFDALINTLASDHALIKAWGIHRLIRGQHQYASELVRRDRCVSPEGRWQLELAETVLESAGSELESLCAGHYNGIVSEGASFLMRAKPVFENASMVYAVSVDTISSFWVSNETLDQRRTRDYLCTQPDNAMRLFVFSNPDSAHNCVTMLNIHARRYGEQGRVFLCSALAYRDLANEIAGSHNLHSMMDCDFALLEYETGSGISVYKATLDGEHFHVTRAKKSRGLALDGDEIRRIFNDLKHLEPGEIHPEYAVMRWEIDLQVRSDEWAAKLQDLFGERERDAIHLVFFTERVLQTADQGTMLREKIREVKQAFEELREHRGRPIRVKDIWFGECSITPALDWMARGRLLNSEALRFPYVLLIRFEDRESLKEWYECERHHRLRRGVFETFDPKFSELFAAIEEMKAKAPDEVQIASMYEEIEAHASEYMGRRDYCEADTIRDIVSKKPFRPKIRFG
jgi:hypothetical protein